MALTPAVIRRRQGRIARCENCGNFIPCECASHTVTIDKNELPINREGLDPFEPDRRDLVAD